MYLLQLGTTWRFGGNTHTQSHVTWKWSVFLCALSVVITIKLLNSKAIKITREEISPMSGGDISLKFLRNDKNADLNSTARYHIAQSNMKHQENIHQPDDIGQNIDLNSNPINQGRRIHTQIRNVTNGTQFLKLPKKWTVNTNNTQMSIFSSIDDHQQSLGVKIVKDEKPRSPFNPIEVVGNKRPPEEFLETYSTLCNNNTGHKWKHNQHNKSRNNNDSIINIFCSCVPPTLREYKQFESPLAPPNQSHLKSNEAV